AAEGASAATHDKPVSRGTTACAPGGATLGLSVAPRDPRLSRVSLRCLLPRKLLAAGFFIPLRHGARLLSVLALAWFGHAACAAPQVAEPGAGAEQSAAAAARDVAQWIERVRAAPCMRPYTGTFVVLSASGAMASSRIWHVCEGAQQLERLEALTGTPRTVFRRDSEVRTFLPQSKVVRTEQREASGVFPRVPVVSGAVIGSFYSARFIGQERVAGLVADVVLFKPKDTLRFGYRLWSERDTGLVVKLQTLGGDGRVLEQAAFSELDMSAPVRADQLSRMMDATDGYKSVSPALTKTTAQAEGWQLRQQIAGFVPVSCHRRVVSQDEQGQTVLQCLYSDGLASVSLFLETYDPQRHPAQAQVSGIGATQMLAQRLLPDMWVTAVGEVPLQTLRLFAGQLERVR
ncbi:MucB/RseB C-terminal domain-containing protein, partial [Paracidovorax sp. MALMAid1276]|uniref:MucB/RseB C-terminal domain-containing protein n=1 Tax=Paracidovorax sp. MALMAid1276 TaxID=3411631 RepID=UPI003B9AF7B4